MICRNQREARDWIKQSSDYRRLHYLRVKALTNASDQSTFRLAFASAAPQDLIALRPSRAPIPRGAIKKVIWQATSSQRSLRSSGSAKGSNLLCCFFNRYFNVVDLVLHQWLKVSGLLIFPFTRWTLSLNSTLEILLIIIAAEVLCAWLTGVRQWWPYFLFLGG